MERMLFWPVEAVQAQGDPFCSQCIHLYNFCTGDGSQALRKQNNQVTNQRSSDWLKVLYRQLHTLGVRSAKASKFKKKRQRGTLDSVFKLVNFVNLDSLKSKVPFF